MTILLKKDNNWQPIENIYLYSQGNWKIVKNGYFKQNNHWHTFWQNIRVATNNTPQTTINIFDFMGQPKQKGQFIFINNAPIIANHGEIALSTGQFPPDSTLTIINNSSIAGYGGNGGSSNNPGGNGGNAISLEMDCTIDNTNGFVYAGGGGGGGLYCAIKANSSSAQSTFTCGGAGGSPNGKFIESWANPVNGLNFLLLYDDPTSCNFDTGGSGGIISSMRIKLGNTLSNNFMQLLTGSGGNIASNGEASTYKVFVPAGTLYSYTFKKQPGGNAGLAINKNGYEITLINTDAERIKGEIL